MKITRITYCKEYKVGLPNYSNITARMEMTVEYKEGEEPNHDVAWDIVNREIYTQTNVDPAWIEHKELKDFHKLVLKVPKAANSEKSEEPGELTF